MSRLHPVFERLLAPFAPASPRPAPAQPEPARPQPVRRLSPGEARRHRAIVAAESGRPFDTAERESGTAGTDRVLADIFRDDGDATAGCLPLALLGPGGDFTTRIEADAELAADLDHRMRNRLSLLGETVDEHTKLCHVCRQPIDPCGDGRYCSRACRRDDEADAAEAYATGN